MCRGYNHCHNKRLPGKDRGTLRADPHVRRAKNLFRLRGSRPATHRPVLVRMDLVPVYPMDCANTSRRMCDDGNLLGLPGGV